jgi:4-amino-4-deoxy-L-arabinose transferase-like glycosyltransferase
VRSATARSDAAERRAVARDAVVLALAALVLRLPAVLAMRHLHPDDGTYGMSAVAMRQGGVPFRDVFSSQGPLHLPLVFLGDLLGGRTADSPRVTPLLAGVAATVLTFLVVRRVGTRRGAWIAGGIVAGTGSMLWTSGPITSDAPTIAFALGALLVALGARDHPSTAAAVAVGLLGGAAILCKLAMGVLAMLPTVVVLARRRRVLVVAAVVAAVLGAAVTLPFGPGDVWDQAVRYQLDSEREQSVGANAWKVVTTLAGRDLVVLVLGALALVAHRRERPGPPDDHLVVRAAGWWALAVVVFLVVQPALWRNHVAHVIPALALLVGLRPPPLRWLAVGLVVAVPVQLVQSAGILAPPAYGGPTRAAYDAIRALPDGAQVLADEVGIVWRSGRRAPDDFVDASIKQLQQGRITSARIAEAASRPEVCGVLVWSARHWGSLPDLPSALARAGYEPVERFFGQDGARVLYARAACPA